MTQERRYWHTVVGYNYRLTNVQAAIGLAQVERLPEQLKGHRQVASWYREELANVPGVSWQEEREWAEHAWWQFVAVIDESFSPDRDSVLVRMQDAGIDARRIYYPMHQLPIYKDEAGAAGYPVAERLAARAVCLPTWSGLQREDVRFICQQLRACAVAPTIAGGRG
jgi:perosamine synthetase